MSLIEVAALEGDLPPGHRRTPVPQRKGALESTHHRVALRRHPNALGEHLDEAPPAQAEHPGDVADFNAGAVQLGKPGAHGRSPMRAVGQARDQGLLEKLETLLQGRSGTQALAELDRARAPEVIEADVVVGQVAGRCTEAPPGLK